MGNTSVVATNNNAPIIVVTDVELKDKPSDSKLTQSKGGEKVLQNMRADDATKEIANQLSNKIYTLPNSTLNKEDMTTENLSQFIMTKDEEKQQQSLQGGNNAGAEEEPLLAKDASEKKLKQQIMAEVHKWEQASSPKNIGSDSYSLSDPDDMWGEVKGVGGYPVQADIVMAGSDKLPADSSSWQVPRPLTDMTATGLFLYYSSNIENALGKEGLGSNANKTFYRNDAPVFSKAGKFISSKTSHTSLVKGGVTISAPVLFHGKLMYTMSASTAVLKQAKNVNIAKATIGAVSLNATNMNWSRIGEKSTFAIIASKDRLIAFSRLDAPEAMPDLQHPERLKYGEMISQEAGIYETNDGELRLQLGGPLAQAGAYGNIGSEHERGKRRITVRASKNENGRDMVVISIVDVKKDETHTKVGGIVSTPGLKGDFAGVEVGSSYNHTTFKSADMAGTREGVVVELDITTKEGRAAYDSIMKTGSVSPSIYSKEGPALYAGELASESHTNTGAMSNTTYLVLPVLGGQTGFGFSGTTGYEVAQKTIYKHLKMTDESSMNSKLDIYSAIDGGGDMNNLTGDTVSTKSMKKRHDFVTYARNVNMGENSTVINRNDHYSVTFVEGSKVIDLLESEVSRVKQGKSPVFKSLQLKLADGSILEGKEALQYLKSHASGNNIIEDWWFGSDKLAVSIAEKDFDSTSEASRMIASDVKGYVEKQSTNGRNRHSPNLSEEKIHNVDTSILNDETITHKLLLDNFNEGEILVDLRKYHDEAKRKESYPLDLMITLPHGSYK